MATPYTPQITGRGPKAQIQRLGGHLAGMVMPNIGAFIAWGLITALFIPTGWLPNKEFGALVDPTINVLLPVLIGYTGGRMVHGQRGAVVGAVATMGVVVGAGIPMFLGAMVMGPLTAFVLKLVDGYIQDRTKPGFEMLVDNFTAGIVGGAAAVFGNWGIKPIVTHVTDAAGNAVEWLIHHHLLPLASVLVEPAKVLFLNNAVNHGVLGPLGVAEAAKHGKSIMFMIESNPGPGLGVLAAYLLFGPRSLRPSVPAAMVIQFLGGIHEIYFPYILMKPRLILASMAGGAAGIGTFMITNAGLVATPSPGSIFAYAAETPRGGYFGVFLGVLIAAAVSFAVGSVLLGFGRLNGDDKSESEPDAATGETPAAQTTTDETKTDEAAAPETAPHGA
jgi:PTS system mannitol-specific IIC component